ncbi:hypothetical protein [Nocardioides dongkuii]|uniref:hypothetical protein n=1 Tax=Nocardioides dongkuii TaxID=2760089 RepID=UPI0015FC9B3E|nr:hypothetical protein [Nocardioides dongkuii]
MTGLPLRGRDVALAAATGALALVDPVACTGRRLLAYRLAMAALVTAGTYDALEDPGLELSPRTRVGVALAAGGGALATMGPAVRLDARMQRWLAAHGVPVPRWVLAAFATGSFLLSAVAENRGRLEAV